MIKSPDWPTDGKYRRVSRFCKRPYLYGFSGIFALFLTGFGDKAAGAVILPVGQKSPLEKATLTG